MGETVSNVSPLSATFFCFAVLGGVLSWCYRADPARRTAALASLTVVFWAWVGVRDLLALVFVSGFVWFVSERVVRAKEKRAKKRWMVLGVTGSLAVLFFFKSVPELAGFAYELGQRDSPFDSWWQPLGVAVLALQAVMCVVDTYRGDAGEATFAETVLAIGFFPRAIAGPLMRQEKLVAQLRKPWGGEVDLAHVATLLLSGALKRYVLMETLLRFDAVTTAANRDLGAWDSLWHLLVGPILFVVDVSAYTDIAMAAGLVCGVRLPSNFNAPFAGWTMGEMWRRWHISISGFFRDYVIAPVRGSGGGGARSAIAILAGVCAIGLWHVAVPWMLLWSLGLGTPIAIETLLAQRRLKRGERAKRVVPSPVRRWAQAAAVFLYIALLAQLFHGAGLGDWWRSLTSLGNPLWQTNWADWWVVVCIITGWAVGAGLFGRLGEGVQRVLSKLPAWALGGVLSMAVTFCAAFSDGGIPRFYYQRLG